MIRARAAAKYDTCILLCFSVRLSPLLAAPILTAAGVPRLISAAHGMHDHDFLLHRIGSCFGACRAELA